MKVAKMLITKRTGEKVQFDGGKIEIAIMKAFISQGYTEEKCNDAVSLTNHVIANLRIFGNEEITIEMIQDQVEKTLMAESYFDVAKAYIIYREKRNEARQNAHLNRITDPIDYFAGDTLGQFVYTRTYSRWREQDGRRETWPETVQRYMDFMKSELTNKLKEFEYRTIQEAILKMEVMPSMRLLQFAGPAAKRCNACIYNCSFIAPESPQDLAEIMYLSMSGTGVGFSVEAVHVNKFPIIPPQKGHTAHCIIEDSKEGWANAFSFAMRSWYDGQDVSFDYSRLRPAGARLKTTGGRSSGPQPLKDLMNFTRDLMLSKVGSKLTPLNLHDIICKIGQIVIAGGVRRSSLISLSDLSDVEIRDCKNGPIWNTNSQRYMSNNSAVYNTKPTDLQFMTEWLRLAESGTGERGIFNRSGLKNLIPSRRVDFLGDKVMTLGPNPCCVSGETWVQTSEGPRRVRDLVGVENLQLIVNGQLYPVKGAGFFHSGQKELLKVSTFKGHSISLTEDHRMYVSQHGKTTWTALGSIDEKHKVYFSNHRESASWSGDGTFKEGWLIGEIIGDGGIIEEISRDRSHSAYLRFWGESREVMMEITRSYIKDLKLKLSKKYSGGCFNDSTDTASVKCVALYDLCEKRGITITKHFTDVTEKCSSDFQKGLIRGFFDADGSVQGDQSKGVSIRLSQNDIPRLEYVQRTLSRLGIQSTLYKNRSSAGYKSMPDGKGGRVDYFCKAGHELVIAQNNIIEYHKLIGFNEPAKVKTLERLIASYKRTPNKEKFEDVIVDIEPIGVQDVYDVTIDHDKVHEFCGNGFRLHNCEILLQSKQFCNLTEVICRPEDTVKSLMRKIQIATILGTFQSSLTKFKYLSPQWIQNQEDERLLGVSLTGIMDSTLFSTKADNELRTTLLRNLKDLTIEVNQTYAKRFRIKPSMAVTAIKPSGTVSQMTNSASGIHARYAPYYIRRVRIAAHDPLFNLMKDQGYPHHAEVGQDPENPNTWVLEFPVKSPKYAICTKDMTAIIQLEMWKEFKVNYTEHNPSVTISVKPHEWIIVQKWVFENWDYVTGLSFLPYAEHGYVLAPYEEITEEEYMKHPCRGMQVNFNKLVYYEKTDTTDVKKELACAGGACEL